MATMQTCPHCGKQTEGVNHNGRGLRCTFCFGRLIEPGQGENVTAQLTGEREPASTGPEYSPPAKKEAEPEIDYSSKGRRGQMSGNK
jgi:hypothetical protein